MEQLGKMWAFAPFVRVFRLGFCLGFCLDRAGVQFFFFCWCCVLFTFVYIWSVALRCCSFFDIREKVKTDLKNPSSAGSVRQ